MTHEEAVDFIIQWSYCCASEFNVGPKDDAESAADLGAVLEYVNGLRDRLEVVEAQADALQERLP